MPDKSTLEKLFDRAPLAIVIIGVFVFIIGAAGGLPIGNPPLQVTDWVWRISLGVIGLILAGAGLILLIRESHPLTTKLEDSNLQANGKSELFLDNWPEAEMQKGIEESRDLLLIGLSLKRTVKNNRNLFVTKLRQGDSINVLLVNPDDTAFGIAANRPCLVNLERTRAGSQETLETLYEIKRLTGGKLEIRTVNYPLTIGGIAINRNDANKGILYLEHYTFKMPDDDKPKFVLKSTNRKWYDYFNQQIQVLWENGDQVKAEI